MIGSLLLADRSIIFQVGREIKKNCWGFKNLPWEEVGRGGNGDLGNDKTLKSF